MELRHLRYIVASARNGSFSAAAHELHVRQPIVSKRVKEVEDELRVNLFDRSKAGARLTLAGEEFVVSARRIIEDVDRLSERARARGAGKLGRIVVGFYKSLSAGGFRAALQDFRERCPDVEVELIEVPFVDLTAGVLAGTIDTAIILGDADKCEILDSTTLWSEHLVVALPGGHPLAEKSVIYWPELKGERFLITHHDPGPELRTILLRNLAAPSDHPTILTRYLEEQRQSLDQQVASKVASERVTIAAEEEKKARAAAEEDLGARAAEITELKDVVSRQNDKLAAAQKEQAELLRKQRELDDAKRELDLTVETRVQQSLTEVRERAKAEAEDALRLKVTEKEQQITSMQRQIDELRRKAEQGSQQLQGEVLELELEGLLRARFPYDVIDPVGRGDCGGDVIHRVSTPAGQACGAMLWEAKRTRNWSDGWLPKLRADQRSAGAAVAILVTTALRKDVQSFGFVDGVWVSDFAHALPLAVALRHSLIEIAAAHQVREGQETKMELVYQYLTGPRFRHRVEAVVEKFKEMREDLDRERKAMTRLWAKREQQIQVVLDSTMGMYGDLQGIAGKALTEIEGLGYPLLEDARPFDLAL